jgi:hypothetical protein
MSRGWEREDERGRLLEAWGWRFVRWLGAVVGQETETVAEGSKSRSRGESGERPSRERKIC